MAPSLDHEDLTKDDVYDPAKDEYDPAKPEYIIPATNEETEHAQSELLKQQIASLEMRLEHSRHDEHDKVCSYERVLAEMYHEAGPCEGFPPRRKRMDSCELSELDDRSTQDSECARQLSNLSDHVGASWDAFPPQQQARRVPRTRVRNSRHNASGAGKDHWKMHDESHTTSRSSAGAFPVTSYTQPVPAPVLFQGTYANPAYGYNSNYPCDQSGQAWNMPCSNWWGQYPAQCASHYNAPVSFAQRF
jgi:hypothetical protein